MIEKQPKLSKLQLEIFDEYDTICRELIDHIAGMWWAFDPKDERAIMIRRIADAYTSRVAAAYMGTPDPEITERIEDELRGKEE